MSPAQIDANRENARTMARSCYLKAIEEAALVLRDKDAKPRTKMLAAQVIVAAAEWDKP